MPKKQIRYMLKVTDETADVIRSLHPQIKSRLRSAFKTFLKDPWSGKALKDDLKKLRSYRVKRYRTIYGVQTAKRLIEIIAFGPRRNIYQDTYTLIQKGNQNS